MGRLCIERYVWVGYMWNNICGKDMFREDMCRKDSFGECVCRKDAFGENKCGMVILY